MIMGPDQHFVSGVGKLEHDLRTVEKEQLQSLEPGAGCGENSNSETFGRDALLPFNLGYLFWCSPFSLSYMCCHIKKRRLWKILEI